MSTSSHMAPLLVLSALLTACSEDEAPTPSSDSDAGTTPAADAATGTGTDPDAGTKGPQVNFCETYVDRTDDGASREITWDFSITSAPERCMKVKVGQTVSWSGNLTTHPITVSDVTPSDVKLVPPGAQVTFGKAGAFGFECLNHPGMEGAILVE